MATYRRSPLQPRVEPRGRSASIHDVLNGNLLVTTLGVVPPMPHRQRDWQNPRGPAFPTELRTWIECLDTRLTGKDKQFRGAGQWTTYDWPNPRGRQFPVENLTWIESLDLRLTGKDKQFAGAGQWKTYDWPNPVLRKPQVTTDYVNRALLLSGVVVASPFVPKDFPNPARRTWQQTEQGGIALPLLAAQSTPFLALDFSNPAVRQSYAALVGVPANLIHLLYEQNKFYPFISNVATFMNR